MHNRNVGQRIIQNVSMGALQTWKQVGNTLHIQSQNGNLSIEAYRKSVIRITANPPGIDASPPSHAVVAEALTDTEIEVQDSERALSIIIRTEGSTDEHRIHCTKDNTALSFLDAEGRTLNQDHPNFSTSWLGSEASLYKAIQAEERFLGLGEKTGPLDRRGHAYLNHNKEIFGYGKNDDPIYVSIPFYLAVHSTGMYGIYLDAVCDSKVDFAASNNRFVSLTVRSEQLSYFFFYGDSPADILESYTWLSGRPYLPPRWAFGYHQSRYSYSSSSRIVGIAEEFHRRKIPLDAIHFDIHYMEHYKVFTWDAQRFPNPKQTIDDLRSMGVQSVVIVDPGIKVEEGYHIYDELVASKNMLCYPDGEPYIGEVWPGPSLLPDFSNSTARKWWGEKLHHYTDVGVRGFWNDMNEPSVWGHSIPDIVEMDNDGKPVSMRDYHNLYGLLMAEASYTGAIQQRPNERPFTLTRSGFAGIQRFAAVWTGDNVSNDDHLMLAIRLLNSLSISGVPICGFDAGGFVGDCEPELFARWIAIAAFTPFFRGHSMIHSRDAEPWSFGERVEEIARNYISLRYQLIPYLYSLAYRAHAEGLPMVASPVFHHPYDTKLYAYDNQFLCGRDILVVPCLAHETYKKICLPAGEWYGLYDDQKYQGEFVYQLHPDFVPVFVRAGAIIPMQALQQSLSEQLADCLFLHVYLGGSGTCHYFEDDGISFAYQEGDYHRRDITLEQKGEQCRLTLSEIDGRATSHFKRMQCYIHGGEQVQVQNHDGAIKGKYENHAFVTAISNFDPLGKQTHEALECRVYSFAVNYPEDRWSIEIKTDNDGNTE